jgi:hypothetical protein
MARHEPPKSADDSRKQRAGFFHAANMVTMVWLPGAASAICLIVGLLKMDVTLLALAAAGGLGTFIGWCFASGIEQSHPEK